MHGIGEYNSAAHEHPPQRSSPASKHRNLISAQDPLLNQQTYSTACGYVSPAGLRLELHWPTCKTIRQQRSHAVRVRFTAGQLALGADLLGSPPPAAPGIELSAWFPSHPLLQFPLGEPVSTAQSVDISMRFLPRVLMCVQ